MVTATPSLIFWDEERDEPYLSIPRFPDIRLTPWREADVGDAVKLFNEPSIAKYSYRRAFPYRIEHLKWQREVLIPGSLKTIATTLRPLFKSSFNSDNKTPISPSNPAPALPFFIIRHQPSGRLIGDFCVYPATPGMRLEIPDPDAEIVWEMAYNLSPEWQGKGVGGAVLDAVIEGWLKWAGIESIKASAETLNAGSSGLLKSRGFEKIKTYMLEWPEEKGGGMREISDWELRIGHTWKIGVIARSFVPFSDSSTSSFANNTLSTNPSDWMLAPSLMRWDPAMEEPYLVLPSFADLRLTPWREGDGEAALKLYNDPTIGKYAHNRPYPYLKEHLSFFANVITPSCQTTIDNVIRPLFLPTLKPSTKPENPSRIPFYPFIVLRDMSTGQMIGDFQIFQPVAAIPTSNLEDAYSGSIPQTTPASEQIWEIAYNLLPEWRGKGIAGQVLDVVMDGWVKWVGIGGLKAKIQTANPASEAFIRSRGFTQGPIRMDSWPKDKGGGEREMSEWVVKTDDYRSRLHQNLLQNF